MDLYIPTYHIPIISSLFTQYTYIHTTLLAAALSALRAQSKGLDVIQTQVDELLPLKNKLDLLCKRVQVVKRAIMEVLNSDEVCALPEYVCMYVL